MQKNNTFIQNELEDPFPLISDFILFFVHFFCEPFDTGCQTARRPVDKEHKCLWFPDEAMGHIQICLVVGYASCAWCTALEQCGCRHRGL